MMQLLNMLRIYGFPIELMTCCVMMAHQEPRRSKWPLRALLPFAVMCMIASYEHFGHPQGIPGHFLIFVMYLAAMVLGSLFTLDIDLSTAAFCGVGAYVCQHLSFKIGMVLLHLLPGSMADPAKWIIYAGIDIVCYFVVYVVYASRVEHVNRHFFSRPQYALLCIGVALYTGLLSYIFEELYAAQLPLVVYVLYASLDVICCFFALSVQYGLFRMNTLEDEKRMTENLLHRQEQQFRMSRENIELINIKCHDLRKQLRTVQGIDQQELKHLLRTMNVYDMSVKTGNEVLDIVLAEKSLQCEHQSIRLECIASGQSLSAMSASDVYALFGNALDNAIESTSQIETPERRIISLTIRETTGMLSIHMENPYDGRLVFRDGLPMTTKGNTDYHGFGLKSIRLVTEKYGGVLSIRTEDNMFELNILLPIPERKQTADAAED